MALARKFTLKRNLNSVTKQLAVLNVELAEQMILLASQTQDSAPLIGAVKALREAQEIYSSKSMPRKNAEVQKALGDTLLNLGRANDDVDALESAVVAYRSAVTLASMLGDENMRRDVKRNYALCVRLLDNHSGRPLKAGAA